MDDADRADAHIEILTRAKVEEAARQPMLPAVGKCYNCNANLADGHRYCDNDCMEDHQYRQQLERKRKRNG